MRTPFVAANWKMFKDLEQAKALAREVRAALAGRRLAAPGAAPAPGAVEVGLFPAAPCLAAVQAELAGSGISLGAQNVHPDPEGPFTGETSCEMVRSCGAVYVICGHSERRRHFREDDGFVNLKVRAALAAGLRPILCVGESLEERERGRTLAVISQQVSLGLDGLSTREIDPLVIAYEPVWAIGTGKNATPAQAGEVHRFIRGFVADRFQPGVAAAIRILYGGSVKAKNAADLVADPDIDGALVGGASLDAKEFSAIVAEAEKRTT